MWLLCVGKRTSLSCQRGQAQPLATGGAAQGRLCPTSLPPTVHRDRLCPGQVLLGSLLPRERQKDRTVQSQYQLQLPINSVPTVLQGKVREVTERGQDYYAHIAYAQEREYQEKSKSISPLPSQISLEFSINMSVCIPKGRCTCQTGKEELLQIEN